MVARHDIVQVFTSHRLVLLDQHLVCIVVGRRNTHIVVEFLRGNHTSTTETIILLLPTLLHAKRSSSDEERRPLFVGKIVGVIGGHEIAARLEGIRWCVFHMESTISWL